MVGQVISHDSSSRLGEGTVLGGGSSLHSGIEFGGVKDRDRVSGEETNPAKTKHNEEFERQKAPGLKLLQD